VSRIRCLCSENKEANSRPVSTLPLTKAAAISIARPRADCQAPSLIAIIDEI